MKKKIRIILISILLVFLSIGGICAYLFLVYKPVAAVNDFTENEDSNQENILEQENEEEINENEVEAILSASVNVFTEADADAINEAISNIIITNQGLKLEISDGTAFESVGIGDIFYLQGDSESPLGETYIGKIVSISDQKGNNVYTIDAPMVDEVFDVLSINYNQVMTYENISEIEVIDGVKVTPVSSVDSYFTDISHQNHDASNDYTITTLENTSDNYDIISVVDSEIDSLLLEFEVDLLEAFGLKDNDTSNFQEKYEYQEGNRIKVYRTVTGICYHRKNCPCVGRSIFEMTLTEAIEEGFEACYLCNPPLLSDEEGVFKFEESLTLEGKVGLESIDYDIVYEWDIMNGSGLENLSVVAKGDFLIDARLKSSLKFELGGNATVITLPFNNIKLQGLDEKLFPIAFIGYNGALTPVVHSNEEIRALTSVVPITVGAALYVDINGNVSVGASAYINYNQAFNYSNEVVKNGQWIFEQEVSSEPTFAMGLETEFKGDIDAHIGGSVSLYIFNLNVVEVAIAKIGAEAEGTLKIDCSTETLQSNDDVISTSYYMRLYYKLLELNIKLKTKIKVWNLVDIGTDIDMSYVWLDKTIAEWGKKNPTRYNSKEMSYDVITASDAEGIYYKNMAGDLIREENGYKSVIYEEDFFTICGIDESYLYVLRNNDGMHDVYRVSKDGDTNRKIIECVTNYLMIDEKYIYYVSNFSSSKIMRMDRETLKEETFYDCGYDVRYMAEQEDGFYVVTEKNDMFSWFFGTTKYYYLLNDSGQVIADYGSSIGVESYHLTKIKDYYKAGKMVSQGYLRNTAEEIFWMSLDKSQFVRAEGISGWVPHEVGIFTTLNNEEENAVVPYKIVLYRSSDGQKVNVTDVESNQAFFTLCQSTNGTWYFFDQSEQELILYSMNEDFSDKTVVKTFTLSEIPYNLSECGMTIRDERIYFYTIPDNTTSSVLYRYDLI